MQNLLIQKPLNSFILAYSLIILSASIKSYKKNQNKSLFAYFIFGVAVKYIFAITSLMRFSLVENFKPITFTYILGQNTIFLKAIMIVDLVSLVCGIIAYRKQKYNIVHVLVFVTVLFQYLGLVI